MSLHLDRGLVKVPLRDNKDFQSKSKEEGCHGVSFLAMDYITFWHC